MALPFSLPAAGPASGRVELASRRGDPVLLEVFAGWCATCRRAAPTVAAAFEAERARPVRFVGVALDGTLAGAERLRRSWKIPYDVAVDDGTVARGYRIDVLPTFVVLDAEGIVRHVSSGAPSRAELERWLAMVGAPAKR